MDSKKKKKGDKADKFNDSSSSRDSSQEKCGECGKPEGVGENWIDCIKCELWFHCKCLHLDKKAFEVIKKHKSNLNYTCNNCVTLLEDFGSGVDSQAATARTNANIENVRQVVFKLLDEFNDFKHVLDEMLQDFNFMKDKSARTSASDSSLADLVSQLSRKVDDLSSNNNNNESMLNTIQDTVQKISLPSNSVVHVDQPTDGRPSTFADKVKIKSKNTLVVKAKDASKKAAVQHKAVAKALNNIRINDTRISKSGHLVIELNDKKTLDSALNTLKKQESVLGLDVTVKNKLSPKILIANIPSMIEKDTIQDDILQKNQWLNEVVKQGNEFKFLLELKNRAGGKNMVFKCSPLVRKMIHEKGNVLLTPYSVCDVYDHYHVVQCFKCQGFHHNADQCKSNSQVCCKCAGSHKLKECKNESVCCTNCKAAGLEHDHWASNKNCPKYIEMITSIRNRTDHGCDV